MKKNLNFNLIVILIAMFSILIVPTKVDAAVKWVWPTSGAWRVGEISEKGIYISGERENNLDVVAARQGVVVKAIKEENATAGTGFSGYGNTVVIRHTKDKYTLYAHLASFNVKAGDKVVAGTKIGTIGNTGKTTVKGLLFAYLNNSIPQPNTSYYDPIKDIYWNKYADNIKYRVTMRIAKNNSFYNELLSNYYKKDGAYYVRNDVPFSSDFSSKYTATAFGEGNIYIICGVAGAFIVVCVCAFIFLKKKNKKDISEDSKNIKEKK